MNQKYVAEAVGFINVISQLKMNIYHEKLMISHQKKIQPFQQNRMFKMNAC